jgi:membrane dipeptidase
MKMRNRRHFLKIRRLGHRRCGGGRPAACRRARQARPLRYADMHAHLGLKQGLAIRDAMTKNGMLIVAEKVIPDGPLTRNVGNRLGSFREARPGELRRNFEVGFGRRRDKARQENLVEIASGETLERVMRERVPALVLSAEGADFLEGELGYLDKARAEGLAHLQLVHYYRNSAVGDISTEEPVHGGLTRSARTSCARATGSGYWSTSRIAPRQAIEHALEVSTKPVIYSHGHVSAGPPQASYGGIAARAIHAPLAEKLAAKGGVIGIWPCGIPTRTSISIPTKSRVSLACTARITSASAPTCSACRARSSRATTSSPSCRAILPKRGMKDPEIEAILGGNYVRVLRQALDA